MRNILCIYGSLIDKKPRKILSMMIDKHKNLVGNKLEFIQKYFRLYDIEPEMLYKIAQQYPNAHEKRSINQFFEPERYSSDFEDDIMNFMLLIITELFEKLDESNHSTTQSNDFGIRTVIIFMLDNAEMMNETDWKFY